ncbi:hypothetical protein WT81_11270 [Burkholderia stagnalis]|nr:hypothetical protein WT80_13880 [Burkholderia stagnalis]KWK60996.1 hypothetical protein WT81_11270 [Burkholderia stagnalis]
MWLGFSLVRGMHDDAAGRIELERASALRSLAGGDRRAALWLAAAAVPDRDLLRGTERDDAVPALPPASEGKETVTDYRAMGFTLGRRPLALLQDRLKMDRLHTAEQLATLRNGQLACGCGLVTVRQRPGTANGVLFLTIEDEPGQVNVILWPSLLEMSRKEALGVQLLAVYGVRQVEAKVRDLIAHNTEYATNGQIAWPGIIHTTVVHDLPYCRQRRGRPTNSHAPIRASQPLRKSR